MERGGGRVAPKLKLGPRTIFLALVCIQLKLSKTASTNGQEK